MGPYTGAAGWDSGSAIPLTSIAAAYLLLCYYKWLCAHGSGNACHEMEDQAELIAQPVLKFPIFIYTCGDEGRTHCLDPRPGRAGGGP